MRLRMNFSKSGQNSVFISFAVIGAALLLPYLTLSSPDELNSYDVARIAELQHLRRTLGESVWPGFGSSEIPVAMAKGRREYLFDHPAVPDGYVSVRLPSYPGTLMYKKGRTLPRLAMTAIPVGGIGTALMPDKTTFDQVASLMQSDADASSSFFSTAMRGGAIADTVVYILVAVHESFHAFQSKQDMNRIQNRFDLPPGSLDEKEFISRLREVDATVEIINLIDAESRHLAQALSAESLSECQNEARLFLKTRDTRRQSIFEKDRDLTVASIASYENGIEWIEGTANYVENRIYELASENTYHPLKLITCVPGFDGYGKLPVSKILSLDRSAEMSSRTRSYAVGAGICSLLDRLGAEWKKSAIEELIPPAELLKLVLEDM